MCIGNSVEFAVLHEKGGEREADWKRTVRGIRH